MKKAEPTHEPIGHAENDESLLVVTFWQELRSLDERLKRLEKILFEQEEVEYREQVNTESG